MANKSAAAEPEMVGAGIGFERIRRITGYLVGTLDRFNNAKRAEEHDRVKHSVSSGLETL
ncbi:MAG: anaerobic ribonucleoside-triphosphate reductase [Oscillospiraceae bacterium]|nr:anaerobic ribonucleoside-triphosphate reductase [Oscillospiraceae bacterium]